MKNLKIFSVLLVICCLAGLFSACDDKTDCISNGSYCLVDNKDSYIVLSNETILFNNVDFSNVEQNIFDYFGESIDVAEILVGAQPYDTNETYDKIYVQIFDIVYLTLLYDNSEKSLSMIGQKFVLQEA